jgi:hypothetical protein
MRRVHLATQLCAHWASASGDSRQAVWICELTALLTWHRIQACTEQVRAEFVDTFNENWPSYEAAAMHYFERVGAHLHVRDGMVGQTDESAEQSLVSSSTSASSRQSDCWGS